MKVVLIHDCTRPWWISQLRLLIVQHFAREACLLLGRASWRVPETRWRGWQGLVGGNWRAQMQSRSHITTTRRWWLRVGTTCVKRRLQVLALSERWNMLHWTAKVLLSQQYVRWGVLRNHGRWLIFIHANCLDVAVIVFQAGTRQLGVSFDLVRACSGRLGGVDHRSVWLLKRWYWPFRILGWKGISWNVLCGFEFEGQGLMGCAPMLSHMLLNWKCLAIWCTIDWGGGRIGMFFHCETTSKRHLYIFLISHVRQRRELLMI